MVDLFYIVNPTHVLTFVITILLAVVYILPILCNPRFRNHNNVFTLNLVVAIICCVTYWLFYFVVLEIQPQLLLSDSICVALNYFQLMCTMQVPLAMITLSVYRLLYVVYHQNPFVRQKQWIALGIGCEWFIGLLLALPRVCFHDSKCTTSLWLGIYSLIVVVILPALICFLLQMRILKFVISSSKRVHQEQQQQPIFHTIQHPAPQPNHRRDLHLVRHVIIMLCIFVGGWSPIYLYTLINLSLNVHQALTSGFILLAKFSIIADLVNLFLYNHELRRYVLARLAKCFRK